MAKPKIRLVVDTEQLRPACVLLQAVYGGDTGIVSRLFDPDTWLVAPTKGMRMVTGTEEEWQRFAAAINTNRRTAR